MVDPTTERIRQAISDRGMFKCTVAELIGMKVGTFYTHERRGDWRTGDLAAIARVLRMRFETLAGTDELSDTRDAEEAA